MRLKILVVDSTLLSSRTIAMMYEMYECEVTLALDIETSVDAVIRCPIDVVVTGPSFYRQHGAQLRAAIKEIRPELCIAATGGPQDLVSDEPCCADVHLRPTHFFTDLCRHMSLSAK